MSENIMVALISASVSLVVALFGMLMNLIHHRNVLRKITIENRNKYLEKLYEKRIELYPEGFRIVSRIILLKKPERIISEDIQKKLLIDLSVWVQGDAGLFMSKKTIKCYYELKDFLGNSPGNSPYYTANQAKKIWLARNQFLKSLRTDIGNLHNADRHVSFS